MFPVHSLRSLAEQSTEPVDVGFVLISAYLVFFMQTGFFVLTVGSIRGKNTINVALKNLLDMVVGALSFYVLGYGFAFGERVNDRGEIEGNGFIGNRFFALSELPLVRRYHWLFNWAFSATANTIVSGAVAERTRFEAYLFFSSFISAFVYPVVVHWMWSASGWLGAFRVKECGKLLFGSGAIDFSGSGVVHMIGGISAFAGAKIVGPRLGRFVDGKPQPLPGHNASFQVLGVFILWFGWYGFNPGSAYNLSTKSAIASNAAIVTTLGAASGCLTTLLYTLAWNKVTRNEIIWDLVATLNGTLTGLVSITAGCGVIRPWAGIVQGTVGGIIYFHASHFIAHTLRIDDPLDAIAVHAFGGMWGVFATGLFADKTLVNLMYGPDPSGRDTRYYGAFLGGGGRLLAAQIIEILVITGWTLFFMYPFFYTLRMLNVLRVPVEEELRGIDLKKHGANAYPELPQKEQFELSVHPFADKVEGQVQMLRMQVAALEKRLSRAFPGVLPVSSSGVGFGLNGSSGYIDTVEEHENEGKSPSHADIRMRQGPFSAVASSVDSKTAS